MINIMFKILTFCYSVVSFWNRKIKIRNIKKSDLVLDVGSGDKPYWRADVIVDKYLTDRQQRHSGGMLFDKNKIFIEADIEKLPFKDKTFDFVFCSHVLEHVLHPDRAIKEITRVAKRGYIEVPHACFDLPNPFPSHLWFCDYHDGKLIFYQRDRNDNFYTSIFKKLGAKYYHLPVCQYLFEKNYQFTFICLYFEKKVDCQIYRNENPYEYKPLKSNKSNQGIKISFYAYKLIYFLMTSLFYRQKTGLAQFDQVC